MRSRSELRWADWDAATYEEDSDVLCANKVLENIVSRVVRQAYEIKGLIAVFGLFMNDGIEVLWVPAVRPSSFVM
jgi:hypothetical protein